MLFRTRIELSGRIYEINNFMCGYTYTNQVFGEPNIQINQYILNTTNPPDDWLRLKKFRIEVTEACINTLLPEYFYHACIISNPLSPENAGSGCILTWFDEVSIYRGSKFCTENTERNTEIQAEKVYYKIRLYVVL